MPAIIEFSAFNFQSCRSEDLITEGTIFLALRSPALIINMVSHLDAKLPIKDEKPRRFYDFIKIPHCVLHPSWKLA